MSKRTYVKDVTLDLAEVTIAGRIMSVRTMKNFSFFDVTDQSGKMQIMVTTESHIAVPAVGVIITAVGTPWLTKTGQISVKCHSLSVLSKSTDDISNAINKGLSLGERSVREKRSLEMIVSDDLRNMVRARSIFMTIVRDQMQNSGFMEVDTPVLSPLRFAGTADVFETTSKSLARQLYLRGTLEDYLKQLVVAGFERVFQIGDCFRNESQALIEFTMLEAMWAYGTSTEMLQLVQDIIQRLCNEIPETLVDSDAKNDLSKKFQTVAFWDLLNDHFKQDLRALSSEEIKKLTKAHGYVISDIGKDFEYKVANFGYDVIKRVLSKDFKSPTFVNRFPACISPLAKAYDDSGEADRGYGFFRGQRLFEVVTEASDYKEQLQKFKDQDERNPLPAQSFKHDELLNALSYGCPPLAGLGFNVNRILAVLLDKTRTSDVVPFPITSAPLPL